MWSLLFVCTHCILSGMDTLPVQRTLKVLECRDHVFNVLPIPLLQLSSRTWNQLTNRRNLPPRNGTLMVYTSVFQGSSTCYVSTPCVHTEVLKPLATSHSHIPDREGNRQRERERDLSSIHHQVNGSEIVWQGLMVVGLIWTQTQVSNVTTVTLQK